MGIKKKKPSFLYCTKTEEEMAWATKEMQEIVSIVMLWRIYY